MYSYHLRLKHSFSFTDLRSQHEESNKYTVNVPEMEILNITEVITVVA